MELNLIYQLFVKVLLMRLVYSIIQLDDSVQRIHYITKFDELYYITFLNCTCIPKSFHIKILYHLFYYKKNFDSLEYSHKFGITGLKS